MSHDIDLLAIGKISVLYNYLSDCGKNTIGLTLEIIYTATLLDGINHIYFFSSDCH